MIKRLAGSIREYKKASILSPIIVMLEVVIECIIPLLTAELVNEIKAGCDLNVILRYGLILLVMAALSLTCGWLAGHFCATAACGFASHAYFSKTFYRLRGVHPSTLLKKKYK